MKPDYIYKNLSELEKGDLFTYRLEDFDTVYYEFIEFDGKYYHARIFQKEGFTKHLGDLTVMVVGKVSLDNQYCKD